MWCNEKVKSIAEISVQLVKMTAANLSVVQGPVISMYVDMP